MNAIRPTSCIEILESRIAPATLVNPTTVVYRDIDGDHVIVKFNKAILDESTINDVFKFSTGTVDGSNATPQQLQLIDLTALAALAPTNGVEINVSAKRSAAHGGDGFVNVGHIKASDIDLGAVYVGGDLGQIDAGNGATENGFGLKSLTVQSMGEFDTSTQAAGGDLVSSLTGALRSLTVKGNIREAQIDVTASDNTADAKIANVVIGGSLFGGSAENSGQIHATGDIGPVSIGGSIIGGAGASSGSLFSEAHFGAIKVRRDIRGGAGADSGGITSDDYGTENGSGIASLTVGGSFEGGIGDYSGSINFGGATNFIKIKGDIRGGAGEGSAYISGGKLGPVRIFGNLDRGSIWSDKMATITIGGSMIGGETDASGYISSRVIRAVTIAHDIIGSGGMRSGSIDFEELRNLSVGGSMIGSSGDLSGSIDGSFGALGIVKIGGDMRGGGGYGSGAISSAFAGTSITIGGSLAGGMGDFSSLIDLNGAQFIKIKGDIRGGMGVGSGGVESSGNIGSIMVRGSLVGGTGDFSGYIDGEFAAIDAINIHGDVRSGNGESSASISSLLQNVTIGGDVIGAAARPVVISSDYSIGKVTIGGNAEFMVISCGGYGDDLSLNGDPDAQIGSVNVGGNWIASSIAAGVASVNGFFGDGDDVRFTTFNDAKVVSSIASITIKGQAFGTAGGTDHFGFVAQKIGSVSIGGIAFPLTKGAANDDLDANDPLLVLNSTNDARVHEIAL